MNITGTVDELRKALADLPGDLPLAVPTSLMDRDLGSGSFEKIHLMVPKYANEDSKGEKLLALSFVRVGERKPR